MHEVAAVDVFETELGWMAIRGQGRTLAALSFGHASADEAEAAVQPSDGPACVRRAWNKTIVRRLVRYAAGKVDDLSDLDVALPPKGTFGRRVLERCRRIRYGRTMTYGQLAAAAGKPSAARAVGNCMAGNRIPLVIPCHRVVASGGRIGNYSAPGGCKTKERLLEMEKGGSSQ